MTHHTPPVSNDNAVGALGPSPGYESSNRLRWAAVISGTARSSLPESVFDWLHGDLDVSPTPGAATRERRLKEFELCVDAMLFPPDDARSFVVRLREHSHATATTARVVVEHARLDFPDTAYVVGLLHDMGIAIALGELDASSYFAEDESFQRIWPDLLRTSQERANMLASVWHLPSTVRYALREHKHGSERRSMQAVAASTFIAEHLAGCIGFGFRDEQPTKGLRQALSTLDLSERDLGPIGRRAEQSLARELWPWPRARCSHGG